MLLLLFFFNDTATTEIYTLSLLDALPIFPENTATFHSRPDHCRCSERSSSRTVEKSPSESYEPAGNSELRPLQFTQSLIWSPSTSSMLTKPTTSGLDSLLKAI